MPQPESRLRARCRMFLQSHAPDLWFTAIEHGRHHKGTAAERAREWQRLAAQGVRQGLGDMLLMPANSPVLWLELKAGANKQTQAQYTMQRDMQDRGHHYVVIRSAEQLGEALERHGIPLAAGWRIAAQIHDAALDTPAKGHNKPPRLARARPKAGALAKFRAAGYPA